MWSYFLVLVRTLAAAFWTNCSLFINSAEQPLNKAFNEYLLMVSFNRYLLIHGFMTSRLDYSNARLCF